MTNEVIVFFAMLVMAHCVNTVVFAVKHKDEDEPWHSFSVVVPSVIMLLVATATLINMLISD